MQSYLVDVTPGAQKKWIEKNIRKKLIHPDTLNDIETRIKSLLALESLCEALAVTQSEVVGLDFVRLAAKLRELAEMRWSCNFQTLVKMWNDEVDEWNKTGWRPLDWDLQIEVDKLLAK